MSRRIGEGVEVLPHDAPRELWLKARQEGVGASEIATVLGISPWGSAFDLYHQKRSHVEEVDSERFRWGHLLEAVIADHFADLHPGFAVVPVGLCRSAVRDWQLATPDRLLYEHAAALTEVQDDLDPVAGLEVKNWGVVSDEWGPSGSDIIPDHYLAQVEQTMDVLGLDSYYVAVLFGGCSYREYAITRNAAVDADIDLLRTEGAAFWARVVGGDEPAIDWRPATTGRLKRLHPDLEDREMTVPDDLADDYLVSRVAFTTAKRRKDEAENRLRHLLGDARYGVRADGRKVVTRSVYEVKERVQTVGAHVVSKLIAPRTKKEGGS